MSRRNPRDRRVKMLRLWLRGLRKMSRRIEDAKKREGLDAIWFMNIPCGERVARRMSVRQFRRYLSGVRKGTIL